MTLRLSFFLAAGLGLFVAFALPDPCATADACLPAPGPSMPSAWDHSLSPEEALRADRMLSRLIGS